jgi:hypothetical protein
MTGFTRTTGTIGKPERSESLNGRKNWNDRHARCDNNTISRKFFFRRVMTIDTKRIGQYFNIGEHKTRENSGNGNMSVAK